MQNTNRKPVRKADLVIAIILAFASWFFVVYNVNPTIERVYKDIPVKFVNEDVLEENGLAIKSVEFETVDVTIEARRNAMDNIDPSRIIVNADLEQAGKGENLIALSVTVPNDASVTKKSHDNIIIEAENLVTAQVDTRVEFVNLPDNSTEPQVVSQSVETVEVRGGESHVSDVMSALLRVDASKLTENETTFSIRVLPVNGSGETVQYITADPSKVTMTLVNSKLKTVPLNIMVDNTDDGEYHRSYTGPETITIKGKAADLAKIESINTTRIDLAGVEDGTEIPLEYDLPWGVTVATASQDQIIKVSVSQYETTTIEIPASSITVSGLPEGYAATADTGVTVEVTGLAVNLATLTAGDFVVTADGSPVYGVGSYDVGLTLSTNVERAELTTQWITITVVEASQAEATVEEDSGTVEDEGNGEETSDAADGDGGE